jgi:hypothetical protein
MYRSFRGFTRVASALSRSSTRAGRSSFASDDQLRDAARPVGAANAERTRVGGREVALDQT